MRIILQQYRPAIRIYKWAVTLRELGHEVTICHRGLFVWNLPFKEFEQVEEIKANYRLYDVLICFNPSIEPKGVTIPIIHAVGDINENKSKEIINLRKARAVIFISEQQKEYAIKAIRLNERKCFTVLNSLITSQTKTPLKSKINNGFINIVYSGTTCAIEGHHRNIFLTLKHLSNVNNIRVHLYPSLLGIHDIYKTIPIVIHEPVSPFELVSELSQYDAGLIALEGSEIINSQCMPNKLFEYLAAGLQIVVNSAEYNAIKSQTNVWHIDEFIEYFKPYNTLPKPIYYDTKSISDILSSVFS